MRKFSHSTVFLALLLFAGMFLTHAAGAGIQKAQSKVPPSKTAPTPVVLVNPTTQAPRIIRNIEEYAPGAEGGKLQISPSNIAKVAMDYLKKNESRLGIQTASLKLRRARKAGKFWVATFVQHYQGIPVFGSRVGLVALANGKIITVGSNFDKAIQLDVKPAVTFEAAVSRAASALKIKSPAAVRTEQKTLIVFPSSKKEKERYSLAWRFLLETKKPNAYAFKVFFVDAHNGRRPQIARCPGGRGSEGPDKGQTSGPTIRPTPRRSKPLAGLRVKVQDKKQNTGTQGRVQLEGFPAGTYDLTLALEGPGAKVYRNGGGEWDDFVDNEAALQGSLRTGAEGSLLWPASDEVNVFYHLNRVQDWFLKTFEYAWECDWAREGFARTQIIACCDSGTGVNGMGGNGGVWFGSQSMRQWARGADVIYHEFTHNVLQEIFDGFIGFSDGAYTEGYAMDEGFADYFAAALTNDPLLAENVSPDPRNLDNSVVYTAGAYNMEGHSGGKIIAGACWDFRTRFGNTSEADQMVFQALNILAAWPPEYYFSDPEKSNFLAALRIAAGESHQQAIDWAFGRHSLLSEGAEAAPAPAPAAGPAPKVTSITPANGQRAYGPTQIVIAFDRAIDDQTYAGRIIVEREDYKGRRAIMCDFFPNTTTKKSVTIKPRNGSEGFAPLGTQTNFYVRLVSGGTQAIKGTNGQKLDGDGDGQPGGDYQAKFWIID